MKKTEFLTFKQVKIGSWWEMASGEKYGYCVIDKDEHTQDVLVMDTRGERRAINYFKLQYKYREVKPNGA